MNILNSFFLFIIQINNDNIVNIQFNSIHCKFGKVLAIPKPNLFQRQPYLRFYENSSDRPRIIISHATLSTHRIFKSVNMRLNSPTRSASLPPPKAPNLTYSTIAMLCLCVVVACILWRIDYYCVEQRMSADAIVAIVSSAWCTGRSTAFVSLLLHVRSCLMTLPSCSRGNENVAKYMYTPEICSMICWALVAAAAAVSSLTSSSYFYITSYVCGTYRWATERRQRRRRCHECDCGTGKDDDDASSPP